MTVQIIMQHFEETDLGSIKVVDCCCGTGGFLVSWIDNLCNRLNAQEIARRNPDPILAVRDRIKQICGQNLYGIDINPCLVRTAQMNLVMYGDGSTNVHRASSLRRPGEWCDEARRAIPFGSMDVVITNPPFGDEVKVDDDYVLAQYQLSNWGAENRRSAMPAEQLFLEAGMNFLKPGGFMGIVLPDGILTNPSLAFIRDWLIRRSKIVASIALPKETFGRNGGVNNPSVLIVQKFTHEEYLNSEKNIIDTSGKVFMCAQLHRASISAGTPFSYGIPMVSLFWIRMESVLPMIR